MVNLDQKVVEKVVAALPDPVRRMLKVSGLYLAGGFVRAVVQGEKPQDIDLFGPSKEELVRFARILNGDRKARETKNAVTVSLSGSPQIQFIFRWVFTSPTQVIESFDFIFFTSDTHFGHEMIIKLAKRPFSSVEEMDETIIQRWNEKVGKNDLIYHLGDFALKNTRERVEQVFNRLNGRIILINGNHEGDAWKIRHRFVTVVDYRTVTFGEQKIVLFHYPIRSWDGIFHGSWHLFGHVHGLLPGFGKSFDIGVDNHNFYPLSFEEVKEKMDSFPYATEESGFPDYVPLEKRF